MLTHEIAAAFIELGRGMQIAGAAMESIMRFMESPPAEACDPKKASRAPAESFKCAEPFNRARVASTPLIGGGDFALPDPNIFVSAEYRHRFRAGAQRLVYVGRCPGVSALSKASGVPQNKVSTCKPGRLDKRLSKLGREAYGSIILADGGPVRDDGFGAWSTFSPPLTLKIAPGSPVSIAGGALSTIMPASMSWRAFDNRFDKLVQLGSLDGLIQAPRYTARIRDGIQEYERAKEIVQFRGQQDFERLVAICEKVVLEYLEL